MRVAAERERTGRPGFEQVAFGLRDGRECLIREATGADAERLCAFLPQTHRESDFLAWFPGEFQMTVEQEKEYLREQDRLGSIIICAEIDDRIIASAGAMKQKFRRDYQAEFGICILKEFWRQGLGRKLTECLLHWGRADGLRKMTLRVFADNKNAIALYRTLGFQDDARLKEDVLRGDGTYGDTLVMAYFYDRS